MVREVLSDQGKTITLKRTGNKTSVSLTSGKLSAGEQKRLLAQFAAPGLSLFPPRPVALGETWEIPQAEVASSLGAVGVQVKSSRMSLSLVEKVKFQGKECAKLDWNMMVSYQLEGSPVNIILDLAGPLYYSLEWQRPLQADLTGATTVEGVLPVLGLRANMNGGGTAELHFKWKHLKVAGRPVTPGLPAGPGKPAAPGRPAARKKTASVAR